MATPPVFTTGQVLTAAQMSAVGMWLVKSDTITSGNIVTITGAFNSDYSNYRIMLSNIGTSAESNLYMRMGTTAGTNYYYAGLSRDYASATTNGSQSAATSLWLTGAVITGTNKSTATIEVQSPQIAQPTTFNCMAGDTRTNGRGATNFQGFLNDSTQYTSFTFLLDGAITFTSCNVKIYGYRD